MAASSIGTLSRGNYTQHRRVTGAPVAADSADLTLINRRNNLRTEGQVSVLGYVRFTGGIAPTVDLIPLLYDADADKYSALPKIAGLLDGVGFEVNVHEMPIFFRIDAVANAPTIMEIRLAPAVLSTHA